MRNFFKILPGDLQKSKTNWIKNMFQGGEGGEGRVTVCPMLGYVPL